MKQSRDDFSGRTIVSKSVSGIDAVTRNGAFEWFHRGGWMLAAPTRLGPNSYSPMFVVGRVPNPSIQPLTERVRSPRPWLGSIATIDLLRAVPEPTLPDWLIAFVSISAGAFLPGVAAPITWLLLAAGIYTFAPRFYPDRMGLPDRAIGFRLLVTGTSLIIAVTLAAGEGATDLVRAMRAGGFTLLLGTTGVLTYLYFVRGWRLLDAQNPPVEPLAGFTLEEYEAVEDEISADLQREGVIGHLGTLLWLVALGVVVVFPCVIAGIITNVLYNSYPLPELLVLGWVGVGAIDRRAPVATIETLDLEAQLYETVRSGTRSVKGMSTTIFAGCGLFSSAGYVLVGTALLSGVPVTVELVFAAPVTSAAVIAVVTAPFVAGVYLLWYWLRQFRRLRPFLEQWVGEESDHVAPARPPGLTAPPTIVAVIAATLLGGLNEHPSLSSVTAVVVPLLLVGLAANLYWMGARSTTQIGREDLAVTGGLIIQFVGVFLTGSGSQLWTAAVRRQLPPVLFEVRLLVIVALLLVLTVYPDINRYHQSAESWRRYIRSAFFIGFGALFGVLGTLLSDGVRIGVIFIAAVTFVGGIALSVTTYYEL